MLQKSLTIKLDWLSFTVKEINAVSSVLSYFGYDISNFTNTGKGFNGYKTSFRSDCGMIVGCDGMENMGINITVPSSALSDLLSHFKSCDMYQNFFKISDSDDDSYIIQALFRHIRNVGNMTRIDICLDDIGNSYFSCDDITALYNNRQIITKSRRHKLDYADDSRICTGQTHYFGSRESEKLLRIYDKHLEQLGKGSADVPEKWTRWEYEIKHKSANALADEIIGGKSLSAVFLGILKDNFRIINCDDSNVTRCSTLPLFEDFLQGVSKVHLQIPVKEPSILRTEIYIKKQAAPSLAALYLAHGSDIDYIMEIIEHGFPRIKPDKLNAVNDYIMEHDTL